MVKYKDEELELFVEMYNRNASNKITIERFKKEVVPDKNGIYYLVNKIPYKELPLHINVSEDKWYSGSEWYTFCIMTRLRIGR